MFRTITAFVGIAALVVGCATTKEGANSLAAAKSPAWSAKATPNEMQVAVSPAGKSLRILGSSGLVLGAGADAIVNAKFRKPIHDALEGYDAAATFKNIIKTKLESAVGAKLVEVSPMGSTAGAKSEDEVIKARYSGLAKRGSDTLLDCVMTFGVYGSEGTLAAKLSGKLLTLPEGHRLWDNTIVATTDPVLANAELGDPTSRMGMTVMNPEFTVDEKKVDRWTADGGAILKQRFEQAATAAAAAMYVDLGLGDDAIGDYTLGVLLMNQEKFKEAAAHFDKALQLDPNFVDARNAHAVNMAFNGQIDDAIAQEKTITETNAGYAPAWFNLAYYYAVKKKDGASAQPCYDKALSPGMAKDSSIEKAIKKSSEN